MLLAVLCPAGLFAASQYIIKGKVIDTSENAPAEFVSVIILRTGYRTVTDENGEFSFRVGAPGRYTVRAGKVGYSNAEADVTVGNGSPANAFVTLSLKATVTHMDEVVVSANRNAVKRSEAPVVVNVLNTKLFETVNSVDLAQTLNYQPGLRVENSCQNCGFPQVRINGLEGPYSQILINSRPVVSSLSGVYVLEQIPVNMIERIEVVRGGGSALFGANAVGGTINVITKDPVDNRFEVGTTISNMDGTGSWEEVVTANANVVSTSGNSGIALYETYRHRDPYDRDGDFFSEIGKLSLNSLGLSGFYRLSPTSRLSLEYHNTSEFRRGGNKFDLEPFMTDITEQTRHNINSGGLNYTQSWRDYRYRLNVYVSAQHIGRSSYYGAQRNPYAYGRTTDITWVGGATFSAEFSKVIVSPAVLTSGLEYQGNNLHDIMTGYGRDMKQNVHISGAFVQNEWKMRRFTFLAGLRLDSHNLIDNPILSPRLNLLYRPSGSFQARATWSAGFRAPQAYDEDLHVTAVGGEGVMIQLADGLKPERSNSVSASVDWELRIGDVFADILLEGFYTRLNNVFLLDDIGTDANGNTVRLRRNGDGAHVYGANLDLKFTWTRFSFQSGFTAQRSEYLQPESWSENPDVAPTKEMPRAPGLYGYFTLTANPIKNFDCSLSGIYTGRMWVPHFAPDPEDVPGNFPYTYIGADRLERSPQFMEVNLKLSYTFDMTDKLKIQLSAGITNMGNAFQKDLDKGTFRDSDYFYGPTRPRTYFAGVKFFWQ